MSLIFRDPYFQVAFAVSLTGGISWIYTKNIFKNISNKKGKVILCVIIKNSLCKKKNKNKNKNWCNWPTLLLFFFFFFKFRCLLISSKSQQISYVFQHWRTLWQVNKTFKFRDLFYCFSRVVKNERNAKITC